ncbi:hypothetical protein RYX36_028448 [Vicia faba]
MIVPVDIPKKRAKCLGIKMSGKNKKVSLIVQETFMHAFGNELVDSINKDKGINDDDTSFNNVDLVETNIDLNMEPYVKPTGMKFGESFVEPRVNPATENPKVDILIFNPYVNEILDEKVDIQSKRNEEDGEGDDIHISETLKRIIEEKIAHVTNKEVIEIDDEAIVTILKILVSYVDDKAKDKKHKIDNPSAATKNIENVK